MAQLFAQGKLAMFVSGRWSVPGVFTGRRFDDLLSQRPRLRERYGPAERAELARRMWRLLARDGQLNPADERMLGRAAELLDLPAEELERIRRDLPRLGDACNRLAFAYRFDDGAPCGPLSIKNLDGLMGFSARDHQMPVFIAANAYALILNLRSRQVNGPNCHAFLRPGPAIRPA